MKVLQRIGTGRTGRCQWMAVAAASAAAAKTFMKKIDLGSNINRMKKRFSAVFFFLLYSQ